jgi:hypothetical protein
MTNKAYISPMVLYTDWNALAQEDHTLSLDKVHQLFCNRGVNITIKNVQDLLPTFHDSKNSIGYLQYAQMYNFLKHIIDCNSTFSRNFNMIPGYNFKTKNQIRLLTYKETRDILELTTFFTNVLNQLTPNTAFVEFQTRTHQPGYISYDEYLQVCIALKKVQDIK